MRKALYILVLLLGSLQIIGYLSGVKPVRALGQAMCTAPLPIVFTEVRGVETFASDFYIQYEDSLGNHYSDLITPEMYNKLEGPYNRRNIYGAAISYGPVLPDSLWGAVLNYGTCTGTLKEELGIPSTAEEISIRIVSRTKNRDTAWLLETSCDE